MSHTRAYHFAGEAHERDSVTHLLLRHTEAQTPKPPNASNALPEASLDLLAIIKQEGKLEPTSNNWRKS